MDLRFIHFYQLVYGNLTIKNKEHFFSCCNTNVPYDRTFIFYGQIINFILILKINFIRIQWSYTYQTGQLAIPGGWIEAGGYPVCHSKCERSCWWGGEGGFLNDILLLHILYCRDTIKFHRCLQRKTDVMTYWKPRDSERLKFAIKLYRVYLLIRICHEVLNELNSFWLHLLFSGWVDNKHSKSRPGETLG